MMINLSLSNEQIAQINLLRDLMNFIKNGTIDEIQKMDREKISEIINQVDTQAKQTPLLRACLLANQDIALQIVKILVDRGANPLYKDMNKQTVMYYLARFGRAKIAEFLLNNYTINLNDRDYCLQSPIFYAARDNKSDIVNLFISKGADVNLKDQNNETCLFYAASQGNYEMCKLLISHGVDVLHVDSKKRTALNFAKKNNHPAVVELLNSYKVQQKKIKELDKVKEKDSSMNEKKKPKKDQQKVDCVLVFTDESGNVHELDESELQQFKKHNERIFNLMSSPQLLEFQPPTPQKKFEKVANRIFNNMWKMTGAHVFHQPVDWEAFNLRDYPTIITRPMDFGTIKTKLQNNAYEDYSHFAEDMRRVFDNCIRYNGENHEYGKIAQNLKREFNSVYSQFIL